MRVDANEIKKGRVSTWNRTCAEHISTFLAIRQPTHPLLDITTAEAFGKTSCELHGPCVLAKMRDNRTFHCLSVIRAETITPKNRSAFSVPFHRGSMKCFYKHPWMSVLDNFVLIHGTAACSSTWNHDCMSPAFENSGSIIFFEAEQAN